MQITFPIIVLIAVLLATLSGLGIGGGSILILWLTMVAHFDMETARLVNLMFFIPTAAISTVFRTKKADFHIRPLIPAMISGCVCAALFSLLAQSIPMSTLKKAFGVVLIITGLRELTYRTRKAK